jgi:purine-binding chemotaxis protein CheW
MSARGRVVDWKTVRSRLASIAASSDAATDLSAEQARAIMDERARVLAAPAAPPVRADQVLEVVTFTLAREHYAVEAGYVREIVRARDVTPVPGASNLVLGVMNLRGEVLAVFDLRPLFGLLAHAPDEVTHVIVIGRERAELGLAADAVHEVASVPNDALSDVTATVAGTGQDLLRGVTPDALIVIDGGAVLNSPRMWVDQRDDATS